MSGIEALRRVARAVTAVALVTAVGSMTACQDGRPDTADTGRMVGGSGRAANATRDGATRDGATRDGARGAPPVDSVAFSSLRAPVGDEMSYRGTRDTAALRGGTISGRVEAANSVVGDTVISPTHDLRVCKPFTETRTPSLDGGVGNAVVWLVGVTGGPMPDAPRRASLTLDRCQLQPRVQRMALGGTLQVTSRDAMSSRLRFVDVGRTTTVRAVIMLNDAGQVVPTADVASTSGLVEVRDDQHPWIRAYIAVVAHPFVVITDPRGAFRLDGVPPGEYSLVIWQEQLGVRTQVVRVSGGAETKILSRK